MIFMSVLFSTLALCETSSPAQPSPGRANRPDFSVYRFLAKMEVARGPP